MTTPNDYSYIWNGTQPGWVLLRINRQTLSLAITFAASGPTLRQVAAVRSAVPYFSAMRPSEAFATLKGRSRISLGHFETMEGRRLAERCKHLDLTVESVSTDSSGYLPFNEQSNQGLLIEDNDLSKSVCETAISQGIRVRHIEA